MTETSWKALRAGLTSQYDGSKWKIGKWRKLPEVTELCVGFNCSPRVIDAMRYVSMEILVRVDVGGTVIEGGDKWTCQKMRVVEAWHWPKEESVRLAIFAAELCLQNWENVYPNDDRPRKAVEAAKAWLENPCDGTAASAAWSARSAASAAAYAAWYAARSAAWSAARSAESAARSARSAAESAGRTLDQIEAYIQSRIPHLRPWGPEP